MTEPRDTFYNILLYYQILIIISYQPWLVTKTQNPNTREKDCDTYIMGKLILYYTSTTKLITRSTI